MSGLPRTGVLPFVAFLALVTAACGATLQTLPAGPGAAAADAVSLFEDAVRACRAVTSLSAEMGVSGSAGGQRLRGRVLVGLAAPDSALLDAAAPFGASLFIYAAHGGDATLLLPRDRRVLEHGDPAAVLEAVTGVPLGPAELRHALTGCVGDGVPGHGRAFGADWRAVTLDGAEVFLRRLDGGRWRVVAIVRAPATAPARPVAAVADGGWRADYSDFASDLPRTVRLTSADGRRFTLRLALTQVEVNPRLEGEVFAVKIPPSTEPLTLDELRRSGPLSDSAQE